MRKHCFEKRHGGNYQGNTASVGKVLFSSISFLPLWAPIVKALLLWVVLYQKRVTIRSTCVCPADCKPKLTVHSPQLIIALQLNQEEENAVVPRIKQATKTNRTILSWRISKEHADSCATGKEVCWKRLDQKRASACQHCDVAFVLLNTTVARYMYPPCIEKTGVVFVVTLAQRIDRCSDFLYKQTCVAHNAHWTVTRKT